MGVTGSQDNKAKKPVAIVVGGGYGKIFRSEYRISIDVRFQVEFNVRNFSTKPTIFSLF